MCRWTWFWWDESAAAAIEYSLILVLVALSIVGGITMWGQAVKDILERAAARFP